MVRRECLPLLTFQVAQYDTQKAGLGGPCADRDAPAPVGNLEAFIDLN